MTFCPFNRNWPVSVSLVAVSQSGIQVFSWPLGNPIARFDGHDDSVRSVAWINDKKLLTASIDRQNQGLGR